MDPVQDDPSLLFVERKSVGIAELFFSSALVQMHTYSYNYTVNITYTHTT